MKKLYVPRTSRRVGFHQAPIGGLKPKKPTQIGSQIPSALGPIKVPKVKKMAMPKMPKLGLPQYGC